MCERESQRERAEREREREREGGEHTNHLQDIARPSLWVMYLTTCHHNSDGRSTLFFYRSPTGGHTSHTHLGIGIFCISCLNGRGRIGAEERDVPWRRPHEDKPIFTHVLHHHQQLPRVPIKQRISSIVAYIAHSEAR